MEEERAAHEYAAHKRYKVPPYDAGQMDEGDRTQHATTGRSMQLQGLGLLYFLSLQGVGAISAEEEDLAVVENLLRGRISVLGGGELH